MTDLVPMKAPLVAGNRPTAIVPTSAEQVWRIAELAAMSGLAPRDLNSPEKCAIAIMHGLEIGLAPMQALQRIAVINGRPTIWGDAALGLVRASHLLEWIKEEVAGEGDAMVATCTVKRVDDPEPIARTFSVADAKLAGLWGKRGRDGQATPWITYPKRMLQMRARAFCMRDVFSDVLGGLYVAEELQGTSDANEPPNPRTIEASAEPPTPSLPPPGAEPTIPDFVKRNPDNTLPADEPPSPPTEARAGEPPSPDEPPAPDAPRNEIEAMVDEAPAPEPAPAKRGPGRPRKDGTPAQPRAAAPEPEAFDVEGWLRDLDGACSGATTFEALAEQQKRVQFPARKIVSAEDYARSRDIILKHSRRLFDETEEEGAAA